MNRLTITRLTSEEFKVGERVKLIVTGYVSRIEGNLVDVGDGQVLPGEGVEIEVVLDSVIEADPA